MCQILQPGAVFVRLDHEQVLERARQAVRDGRGDPPKDVLACPGPLLADDAGDPELSGLEHALLFKKLPCPAHKGEGLFQTAGLFEEELLQLRCLGVIKGRSLR